MVASDRVSAFDVIMAEPIPDKGRVLTAMTVLLVRGDGRRGAGHAAGRRPGRASRRRSGAPRCRADWAGRAVLVRRAEMLQLECIVRGYLAGQAYEEYERSGTVHGTRHAGRPAAGQPAGRADLHPLDQGGRGARRQHRLRRRRRPGGRARRPRRPGTSASSCTAGRRPAPPTPASCWPTPSSSSATSTACSACATRCARPTRRGCWPADAGGAGHDAARLRQAAPARLAGRAALGPHAAAAAAARRGDRRPCRQRYVAAYERVTGRSLDDWYGATP